MKFPDFNLHDDEAFQPFEIDWTTQENSAAEEEETTAELIKTPKHKGKQINLIQKPKYEKAENLARRIELGPGDRYNIICQGDFIFGDFIEAFIVHNDILVPEMLLATLSMNQDNIDSLANLINGDYVQKLDMAVSHYFYSHEQGNLIPYLFQELTGKGKGELAVSVYRTHCKICQFTTAGGKKIVIHGSANLRSSVNMEQFTIEENPELFDFNADYFGPLNQKHRITDDGIWK